MSTSLPHPPAHEARHRPLAEKLRAREVRHGTVPVQLVDRGTGIEAEDSGHPEAVEPEQRHQCDAEIPRCMDENALKDRGSGNFGWPLEQFLGTYESEC